MASKLYPVRSQRMEVLTLTDEQLTTQARSIANGGEPALYEARGMILAMIGPSMFLGKIAIERPKDFYLDDRTGGFPYPDAAILQAVEILKRAYVLLGITEPQDSLVPNLGVL